MMELYLKYRPKKLSEVIGQDAAVNTLKTLLSKKKVPHAILFSGPSGCGKTTLARILARQLGCTKNDFHELNIADVRGIDEVRSIQKRMSLSAFGACRVWLLDECHRMVNLGQDCLLKMLEDTPSHVYFMLATTDPEKLQTTVRTRCTHIKVKLLSDADLDKVLCNTLIKENMDISKDVCDKIIEHSQGSARKALVLLHSISEIENKQEQIEAIENADENKQAILIARALLKDGTTWKEMCSILNKVDEDPESIRWMVLAYTTKVMSGGGKFARCQLILQAFSENYWNTKKAGLFMSCGEVISSK